MASRERMSTKKRRNTKHGKISTTPLIMIIVMALRWCSVTRWKQRYNFLRHLRLQIDNRRSSPNSAHSSYHPYYTNCWWSNGPDLLTGYWLICQYTNFTCHLITQKKYFARSPCYFSSTPLQITCILTYVYILFYTQSFCIEPYSSHRLRVVTFIFHKCHHENLKISV